MSTPATIHLTKDEEKEFREIFNLVDRDKGGSISKQELAQLMDTLAINASQVTHTYQPHTCMTSGEGWAYMV